MLSPKFCPVTVTKVPPVVGPLNGLKLLMKGAIKNNISIYEQFLLSEVVYSNHVHESATKSDNVAQVVNVGVFYGLNEAH